MATDEHAFPRDGDQKAVVVNCPTGREFVWVSADSPLAHWKVDETVVFRKRTWRVVGRAEERDSLSLMLGPLN